jgi:hypothetical protein
VASVTETFARKGVQTIVQGVVVQGLFVDASTAVEGRIFVECMDQNVLKVQVVPVVRCDVRFFCIVPKMSSRTPGVTTPG